jgi:hypothetical protein
MNLTIILRAKWHYLQLIDEETKTEILSASFRAIKLLLNSRTRYSRNKGLLSQSSFNLILDLLFLLLIHSINI